jgi:hypothetical protein
MASEVANLPVRSSGAGIKAFGPPPLFPHLCESLFLPSLSCMAILPQAFASSTFFHASPPGLYRRIRRGQSEKCLVVIASSYSLTPSAALSGRPSQPWINRQWRRQTAWLPGPPPLVRETAFDAASLLSSFDPCGPIYPTSLQLHRG